MTFFCICRDGSGRGTGETEGEAYQACWPWHDVTFCSELEYLAGRLLPPPATLEQVEAMLPHGVALMQFGKLCWGGYAFWIREGGDDPDSLMFGHSSRMVHTGPDGEHWLDGYPYTKIRTIGELKELIKEYSRKVSPDSEPAPLLLSKNGRTIPFTGEIK